MVAVLILNSPIRNQRAAPHCPIVGSRPILTKMVMGVSLYLTGLATPGR